MSRDHQSLKPHPGVSLHHIPGGSWHVYLLFPAHKLCFIYPGNPLVTLGPACVYQEMLQDFLQPHIIGISQPLNAKFLEIYKFLYKYSYVQRFFTHLCFVLFVHCCLIVNFFPRWPRIHNDFEGILLNK